MRAACVGGAPSSRSMRATTPAHAPSVAMSPVTIAAPPSEAASSRMRASPCSESTRASLHPRFDRALATSAPRAPAAPDTRATSTMRPGYRVRPRPARASAVRSGRFVAEVLEARAQLSARALLDLAYALLADTQAISELLQGARVVGHQAGTHDEELALRQARERLAHRLEGATPKL